MFTLLDADFLPQYVSPARFHDAMPDAAASIRLILLATPIFTLPADCLPCHAIASMPICRHCLLARMAVAAPCAH